MSYCNKCDSHVSDDFARVFSDKDGLVWACPSCSAQAGIAETAQTNRTQYLMREEAAEEFMDEQQAAQ